MTNKISVIIPSYNSAKYLPEALQSILSQTQKVHEIILIDDGSTDNTEQLIALYPEVSYFKQINLGIATALNEGIKRATGNLLTFLDADDIWLPDKITIQLNTLRDNPAMDMIFGWIEQFISPELPEHEKLTIDFHSGAMIGRHKSTWMIRREAFQRVGFFKGSFALEEFLDWYMKAKEAGLSEIVIEQTLAKRRIHDTNASRINKNLRKQFPRLLKAALDRRRQND